jgi:hypothetical protein
MGMRSPGPVGSAAVVVLAPTYAHVLLELAEAVLAIVIAVQLLGRPVLEAIADRVRAERLLDRLRCEVVAVDRSPDGQRGTTASRPSRTPEDRAGSASHRIGSRSRSPM